MKVTMTACLSIYLQTAHNSCNRRTLNTGQGGVVVAASTLHTAAYGYLTVTFFN
jgi:pectin methylesterase-like acyl-CoA thioesterase